MANIVPLLFLFTFAKLINSNENQILKETLCRLQELTPGTFQPIDKTTLKWIRLNKTLNVIDTSANGNPIVCHSFEIEKHNNGCYSVLLDNGLYKQTDNNTIEVFLTEQPWELSLEDYALSNDSELLKIPCIYGHFFSCVENNIEQIAFGLSGSTLYHLDTKSETFLFLEKKYYHPFVRVLNEHIQWPTICFERNLHFKQCNHRHFINSRGYIRVNETQYYVNSTGKNYKHPEYKEYIDGTLEICDNSDVDLNSDIVSYSVTLILYSVSIVCLLIHIIAYFLIPEMQELHGKIVLTFAVCLLFHDSLLIVRLFIKDIPQTCKVVGILIHFLRMGYFSWNWVIALDLYFKFKRFNITPLSKSIQIRHYLSYSAIVWTFVTFIIAASVVSDEFLDNSEFQARYGHACDTSNRAVDVFFLAPAGVVLLANVILYILTWRSLGMISLSTQLLRCKISSRKVISCYIRLTLILILSWIFIIIFKFTNHLVIRMTFNILIAFQGFYVFFSVSSPLILKKYRNRKMTDFPNRSHSSSGKTITSVSSTSSFKIPPIVISKPSTDSIPSISVSLCENDHVTNKI